MACIHDVKEEASERLKTPWRRRRTASRREVGGQERESGSGVCPGKYVCVLLRSVPPCSTILVMMSIHIKAPRWRWGGVNVHVITISCRPRRMRNTTRVERINRRQNRCLWRTLPPWGWLYWKPHSRICITYCVDLLSARSGYVTYIGCAAGVWYYCYYYYYYCCHYYDYYYYYYYYYRYYCYL